MIRKLMPAFFALAGIAPAWSQVTSEPTPLQEDSQGVVIYYHADQGNKGLMGQLPSQPIYAHTGVITSTSTSGSDWKYAPTWGDNSAKYQLQYVSDNLWKLDIGDIRTYYGITNPAETIERLAFVFRSADSKKEGKTADGKDIYLNVYASGLQIALESSLGTQTVTADNARGVVFKAGTTRAADITITVNGTAIAQGTQTTLVEATYDFPAPGDYTVLASATSGGETVSSTLQYAYITDSAEKPYPGGAPVPGAVRNADGTVTFCLAAPGKKSVVLAGSWNGFRITDTQTMWRCEQDGQTWFWTTVGPLSETEVITYYYVVDGSIKVGDPYARLVLDPWNDKYIPDAVYPDLPEYPFEQVEGVSLAVLNAPWSDYTWRYDDRAVRPDPADLIIYELLLRDFTGTEGQALGDGTVRKAIEKIPYLADLGVNAVELLPINEFNGNISWGYNPNFYFAPDKAYGTPRAYKEFIDQCHRHGIMVILDVVFNQTDWQHPWYRMYPVGQNPFYNATAPHAYSVLNDWNQGHPLVQRQFEDVLRYWLEEYHVDGFRFDLVKGLGDNDSYANNGDAATNAYNASRVARMKALHDAMRQVDPTAYFINENLAGQKEENEMAADGELNWAVFNNAGCQFAMGYASDSDLSGMYAPNTGRTWGSTVSYLESHDEQRLAYKQEQWGAAGVKGNREISMRRLSGAAAQMIMAPGSHMIWQFSEMGNAQNTKDQNGGNNTDPKTVCWSLLDNEYNHGLMESYRSLIAVRLGNKDLFGQQASFNSACRTSDWSQGRWMQSRLDGRELITVVNPNVAGTITVNMDFLSADAQAYTVLSQTYHTTPAFNPAAGTVTVPADSYVVVGTAGLNEVDAPHAETLCATTRPGEVHVAGACGQIRVLGADGSVRYRGPEGPVALPAGLYIVADESGAAVKALVR